jgi:hypothetical protein
VATASTSVPVAVASAEIVTQSVMGHDSVVSRASCRLRERRRVLAA